MSVATEFPPEVFIPERARPARPGGRAPARHLAVVPATGLVHLAPASSPAGRTGLVPPVGSVADGTVRGLLTIEPAASPIRLTRRGVAVMVALTLALGMLLLVVAGLSAGAGAHPQNPSVRAGAVTVQPGDTLWSIAQRVAPARDPRQVVDDLQRVNHLASVTLTPGQTLKVH